MRKALLVFPIFQSMYPRPFRSFMDVAIVAGRMCPDWRFGTMAPERQSLPMAMNLAVQAALQQRYDAMIVFDDDCFPPYDCVPRLLKHYDEGRQFVAGVGVMRNFPHTTTMAQEFTGPTLLSRHDGEESVVNHRWLDDVDKLQPLQEVSFCGVPVALFGRQLLEDVKAPHFGLLWPEDGGTVTHDVYFCRKAKQAGYKVLVDTTIKCGHLGEAPIITFANRAHARELLETPAPPVPLTSPPTTGLASRLMVGMVAG